MDPRKGIEKNNKDLTKKGVPEYDDDGKSEDQDGSIKDIIQAIRADFKAVSRKVDAFETNLGSTKNEVKQLADQVKKETDDQATYREKARIAASQTTAAIVEVKPAQQNIETNQAQALQKLQQKVLQELDNRNQSTVNLIEPKNTTEGGTAEESEWVRRARIKPQVQMGGDKSDPEPQSYTDMARKIGITRP